ncbi:T9SS type A sorting domain-containing protein [Cryomorpha ignava]|uniref:T9SS type A sorting domain-containing protein n=1 Tax=Cryomorpha ignava TaxID=101383 RepID=A0A7K3WPH6_9FLAO|nr:T9SS type A sorting domain-containing protein [Cryomorpha ignava]NEN23560.1 T9SS type A sorting domain-containing protein [Cryomorpha ignava]
MKKWTLFLSFCGLIATLQAQPPCTAGTVSSSQTICSGSSAATLSISGFTVGADLQWQSSLNNIAFTDIVGSTGSSFAPGSLMSTTYYRVEVSEVSCLTAFSDTLFVTVNQPPTTAPTAIAGYTSAICSGTSLILTASGGNVGSGADYQWGTGAVSDANAVFLGNPFTTGNLTTDITYWVRLKGNTACQQATAHFSKAITVHQPPTAPTAIAGGDNMVCNGASVTLMATGGLEGSGADYQWGWGNQVGTNLITTTDLNNWQATSLTSDTTFWVRRIGTSSCTTTTGGVSKLITVRPVPSVIITNPGELCQLPAQPIVITNATVGQQPLQIQWASATAQSGSVNITSDTEINLNLTSAGDNSNFIISSYGFTDAPVCTNSTPISAVFGVKPRPIITSILHNDLTPSDNSLCQGYGPVEFLVQTPDTVDWEASYFINNQFNEGAISENPFNVQIDSAGTHKFVVDSLWYNGGLSCGYNPADYELPGFYSNSVTIKPTPPAVEFIDGAPSILQFCNYASPLVIDSVARINDLNPWVDNGSGYNIEWKDSNDNSASSLNNIPLENGGDYYPVFELNGCHSKLNSSSLSFIINLIPLPDMLQSSLVFPTSICSGTPFDILFNPSENISHFAVSDFIFNSPLSSPNITDASSYPNIPGLNFSITNSSPTATSWDANIYAQNKNVSETNPVTCWALPVPIEILVNPNATFNPATANFESCQDGPNFIIDPGWNGIGDVDWDDPLGLPASVSIDQITKKITVDMNAQTVPPGIYPIRISGGYPDSNCEVDTIFNVSIYASPEIAMRILDVDATICHNEYTHIEVIDPHPDYEYQWSCTGCESSSAASTYFLPHWLNPEPLAGIWSDLSATYSITVTDASTSQRCASSKNTTVNVLADYASCPEGIDFFLPNGLSVVDEPALYFQWYDVESAGVFSAISGATDQTYFPNDALEGCDTSKYIVATSLYSDRCWSTTVNCFDQFELRACDGPKSKATSPKFLLYPNPVVGRDVVLENLSEDLEGRYSIELIDIAGKSLMSDIIQIEKIGQKKIILPKVDKGVYLLRLSNSRHSETFKIIIN